MRLDWIGSSLMKDGFHSTQRAATIYISGGWFNARSLCLERLKFLLTICNDLDWKNSEFYNSGFPAFRYLFALLAIFFLQFTRKALILSLGDTLLYNPFWISVYHSIVVGGWDYSSKAFLTSFSQFFGIPFQLFQISLIFYQKCQGLLFYNY